MANQTEDLPAVPDVRESDRETNVSAIERAVSSHMVFREVNERIAELTNLRSGLTTSLFICECSSDACAESLEITTAEYDAAREHSDRFFVLAGHQLPAIEEVVEGNDRFLVVRRTAPAAEIAIPGDEGQS